ncbi:MAG: VOC family protein [Gammaproteobacteria bacterium]|jgi:hypothetical protein
MKQRFSHVAMTVRRALLEEEAKSRWLGFYERVFGWSENPQFAIPGERVLIRAPNDGQYLNARASDTPMQTSGYEHLGLWVESEQEVRRLHAVAQALSEEDDAVVLGDVQVLYDGRLTTFRVQYMLPLTIEVQFAPASLELM